MRSAAYDTESVDPLASGIGRLTFQTDVTRVITFQMAREASTRTYPQIGINEAHHPISHHGNQPEKLTKLAKINAYHVALFAYLV